MNQPSLSYCFFFFKKKIIIIINNKQANNQFFNVPPTADTLLNKWDIQIFFCFLLTFFCDFAALSKSTHPLPNSCLEQTRQNVFVSYSRRRLSHWHSPKVVDDNQLRQLSGLTSHSIADDPCLFFHQNVESDHFFVSPNAQQRIHVNKPYFFVEHNKNQLHKTTFIKIIPCRTSWMGPPSNPPLRCIANPLNPSFSKSWVRARSSPRWILSK